MDRKQKNKADGSVLLMKDPSCQSQISDLSADASTPTGLPGKDYLTICLISLILKCTYTHPWSVVAQFKIGQQTKGTWFLSSVSEGTDDTLKVIFPSLYLLSYLIIP